MENTILDFMENHVYTTYVLKIINGKDIYGAKKKIQKQKRKTEKNPKEKMLRNDLNIFIYIFIFRYNEF